MHSGCPKGRRLSQVSLESVASQHSCAHRLGSGQQVNFQLEQIHSDEHAREVECLLNVCLLHMSCCQGHRPRGLTSLQISDAKVSGL